MLDRQALRLLRLFFFKAFLYPRFPRNKNCGHADNGRSKNASREPRISDYHRPRGNTTHEQNQSKGHPLAAKSCHVLSGDDASFHLDSMCRLFFDHREKPVGSIGNVLVIANKKIRAWDRRRLESRNMLRLSNNSRPVVDRFKNLLFFLTGKAIKKPRKLLSCLLF